jgi:hypothetical protein
VKISPQPQPAEDTTASSVPETTGSAPADIHGISAREN